MGVRVGLSRPTAYAVGYSLPPAPRAQFFNELLTQDTSQTLGYIETTFGALNRTIGRFSQRSRCGRRTFDREG
jgi:hypothetical protein